MNKYTLVSLMICGLLSSASTSWADQQAPLATDINQSSMDLLISMIPITQVTMVIGNLCALTSEEMLPISSQQQAAETKNLAAMTSSEKNRYLSEVQKFQEKMAQEWSVRTQEQKNTECSMLRTKALSMRAPSKVPTVNPVEPFDINKLRIDAIMKVSDALMAQLNDNQDKMNADLSEAISLYDKILTVVPDDISARNGRGIAKETVKIGDGKVDLEAVIKITSETISKNPSDAEAYHGRAVAYRSLKKFDEARMDYQKAISLKPENTRWTSDLKAMEIEVKYK